MATKKHHKTLRQQVQFYQQALGATFIIIVIISIALFLVYLQLKDYERQVERQKEVILFYEDNCSELYK